DGDVHLRPGRRRRRAHGSQAHAGHAVVPAAARGRGCVVRDAGVIMEMLTVPLWRAAHGRTGDKGNRSNISLIAWHPQLYPLLVAQITEAAVAARFAHRRPSRVQRFLLPRLNAMNFVLDNVLDGGVNDSLNLDSHGK